MTANKIKIFIFTILLFECFNCRAESQITIASKTFTESVILGELASQITGAKTVHQKQLGGTRVLWSALLRGDIDIYPEYSGTLLHEIFAGHDKNTDLHALLKPLGIAATRAIGFNNTYALGMRPASATELGINTISDLANHPELQIGFSNEFINRSDGWPGLQTHYRLPQKKVRGLDHDLAYRGLTNESLDVIDLYTTDAEIHYYNIKILHDDLNYFPEYNAIFLYRLELEQSAPQVIRQLKRLENVITADAMTTMNMQAKLERVPEAEVAAKYLSTQLNVNSEIVIDSRWSRLVRHSIEHLVLVGISLGAAILVALPLGIAAYLNTRLGQFILSCTAIIQTIPSLALLVFMIPLLGIGSPPAIAALFLYSLLPIIRNTHTGLHDIAPPVRESAKALGLSRTARLRLVELPLATRSILAGIKTSAVINVGTATLGALIGAGGYGQPILTGIRLDDTSLILEGAIPAALLALLVQYSFDLAERLLISKGLRS